MMDHTSFILLQPMMVPTAPINDMISWKPPNLITTVDSSLIASEEATICAAFTYNVVIYEQQAPLRS